MNIAKTLAEQLEFCDLSVNKLAVKLGRGPSTVENWINGKTQMKVCDLYAVCLVLDCTIDDILSWSGYEYDRPAEEADEEEAHTNAGHNDDLIPRRGKL